MASVFSYSGGLKRIEFSYTPNGPRKIIRLGRINAKQTERIHRYVEAIIADKLQNRPHDAETCKFLAELDEKLLARLRAAGLADGVGLGQTALGEFLARCESTMTAKQSTRIFYGHTRRNLKDYFGEAKLLRTITAADVDAFRAWLVGHEKLSPATVARRIIAARTMWRKAIRWKLAAENVFAGIKAGHQENDSRKRFISREDIDKVIAEAPDAEWKLIIALARYGALRTPSEQFALKWRDLDWGRSRFTVHSSKTEHHEGKATRVVPIFPELLPYLREAFEKAEDGAEHVIAKHRLGGLNLRQQFERIIESAGLKCWPRLFQNLRASRETELMREYDLATVCKWIGNSPAVAAKHYAMSVDLDADFRRAAGCEDGKSGAVQAQQKAQQTTATSDGQRLTDEGKTNKNAPETGALDECCQLTAMADKSGGWAIQDSNL